MENRVILPTLAPTLKDSEVMHASVIMGTYRFIYDIDQYYLDPSYFNDVETVDLDGWSVEPNDPLKFPEVKLITRYGNEKSK